MDAPHEASSNDVLYDVFLERAASGVERWQEISLDELGQLQLPYQSYGARQLKDFVAQCTKVAGIRGKTVYLHRNGIERIETALVNGRRRDGAASGGMEGGEPHAEDGVTPADDQMGLAEQLRVSPLAAGLMALREADGAEGQAETILYLVLRAWTSFPPPGSAGRNVGGIDEVLGELPQLGRDSVAVALVHVVRHIRERRMDASHGTRKLAHSLDNELREIADRVKLNEPRRGYRSPVDRLDALATLVGDLRECLLRATRAFCADNSVTTAGEQSVELVKAAKAYSPVALPEEREAIDTHLAKREGVVGSPLRRFCSACAGGDTESVAREADRILATVSDLGAVVASAVEGDAVSTFVAPLVARVEAVVDEGTSGIATLSRPEIVLLDEEVKIDLTSTQLSFLVRVRNIGRGRASDIVTSLREELPFSLEAVHERVTSAGIPAASGVEPFDLAAGAEQIVEVVLRRNEDVADAVALALGWTCGTASGDTVSFCGTVVVRQQRGNPDWDGLRRRPPYTPRRPIEEPHKLFGRGDDVDTLCHYARSGQSTFISGQKRVGKTSVLNVVQRLLADDVVVAFLRRGAIQDQDQGSIAHRIARELSAGLNMGSPGIASVPDLAYFGAFLGDGLVEYVGQLKAYRPDARYLVVFDEFEEINDALFVGDNVSRFTAGLRSLSELGLTFFLAGSERIRSIKDLSSDFNNWGSHNLGRIESFSDLRALIEEPVSAAIEFSRAAVDRIVEYCQGNPYYTVLLCDEIYQRCARLDRTHVSKADVDSMIDVWLSSRLIEENFSHFWEDEPALGPDIRRRHQAESALAIACVSALGGHYAEVREAVEAQERFELADHQILSVQDMSTVLARLHGRGVLKTADGAGQLPESGTFALDVFRDWMAVSGTELKLVERWRRIRDERGRGATPALPPPRRSGLHDRESPNGWKLPVSDREVHDVSRALRGSDVTAESLKEWLRQFNDDARVLVAWKLVKCLAEKGYMGSGHQLDLAKNVREAMSERRRAISGKANGAWRVSPSGRRRYIDLCMVWLDDGAAGPARLLQEQIPAGLMTHDLARVSRWIADNRDRRQSDPILALVDDFAGTGRTLIGGLGGLAKRAGSEFDRLVREGRVVCCVLAAFPEAEQAVRKEYPEIRVVAGRELSSELKAFHPGAEIFESAEEVAYAKRVINAIGQEIAPSMPLGYEGMEGLVALGSRCPNNSLPVFWSDGTNRRPWIPLFARP